MLNKLLSPAVHDEIMECGLIKNKVSELSTETCPSPSNILNPMIPSPSEVSWFRESKFGFWKSGLNKHTRFWNRFRFWFNQTGPNLWYKYKYIDVITNADIRLIFTRLRTDLNVLKTCKINTDINKNCPYGCNEQETVAQLLIRCRKFDEARSEFVSLCAIRRYKLSSIACWNIFWI